MGTRRSHRNQDQLFNAIGKDLANAVKPAAVPKVVYEVTVPVCLMVEIEVQENERATQLMALAISVARVRRAVQGWKTCPMLAAGSRATIGKPGGT